ncbi:unnamed protein product [Periconia digitata]|uniref:Cytochrome b5 heme-binding domain-containing protein n=1 Tax=Periconia digitata TaxID=1303443 RepID=A0A9W4XKP4_9PLEO|nr:unnamed protein product [Periconia digitata]
MAVGASTLKEGILESKTQHQQANTAVPQGNQKKIEVHPRPLPHPSTNHTPANPADLKNNLGNYQPNSQLHRGLPLLLPFHLPFPRFPLSSLSPSYPPDFFSLSRATDPILTIKKNPPRTTEPESQRPKKKMSESFTPSQVAAHATVETGLYIIIDSSVYALDKFVDEHPGGAKILKRVGGKDASKQFWKYHNEHVLKKYGEKLKVGVVKEEAKL